jgi:4'-phosphopantetheinyl transferase
VSASQIIMPNWITSHTFPQLQYSEIHVWCLSVSNFATNLNQYWQILNHTEQQQAQKFIQTKHQERFIIIHGILRQLLANYLTIEPTKINFTNNEFGKPYLSSIGEEITISTLSSSRNPCEHEGYIHFNISHSEDVALLAFSKNLIIGIDVEFKRKNIDAIEIAKRFFTAKEADTIINTSSLELQLECFFNYWTYKEAFVKAIGQGLNYPLNKFEIDIENLNIHIDDPKYNSINWSLAKIDPNPNYSAAIAIAGDSRNQRFFKIN